MNLVLLKKDTGVSLAAMSDDICYSRVGGSSTPDEWVLNMISKGLVTAEREDLPMSLQDMRQSLTFQEWARRAKSGIFGLDNA